jgi:hypothetical protein
MGRNNIMDFSDKDDGIGIAVLVDGVIDNFEIFFYGVEDLLKFFTEIFVGFDEAVILLFKEVELV